MAFDANRCARSADHVSSAVDAATALPALKPIQSIQSKQAPMKLITTLFDGTA